MWPLTRAENRFRSGLKSGARKSEVGSRRSEVGNRPASDLRPRVLHQGSCNHKYFDFSYSDAPARREALRFDA